jgi:UDP-N-acetyl-D-glucosamine/UDP-N-acetyl-D-galactosamine dehydrogenase
MTEEKIAVIGLGYVGLPLALALARRFSDVIGFDVKTERLAELRRGEDVSGEVEREQLVDSKLVLSSDAADLRDVTFFVIAVPTPIDASHSPDLGPVMAASRTVGSVMRSGAVVVYESTVYPGVTEDVCGPLLEQSSGLRRGVDFKLGYSPERINPGDREHSLERVMKIVSGEDPETLERVAAVYGRVVDAGIHRAPSIKVAEAAKVIENIQRDINIALINEIAMICDRVGIRTADVLAAAGSKWNFLPFEPGLVGGHCIGVDPYYLTQLAERLGYHPQVILAGRRINEGMGAYIAQRVVKLLAYGNVPISSARVGILGLTFKQDVSDIRNTKVVDIVNELHQFGIEPLIHDPRALPEETKQEYGITLAPFNELSGLDALVVAVPHREFKTRDKRELLGLLKPGGILVDVKSMFAPSDLPDGLRYWSL